MAMVEVDNLTYYYPGASQPALAGISWSLKAGQMALITGGAGSGKSTLLRAIGGLVPHFYGGRMGGGVRTAGLDTRRALPAQLARSVGLVLQDPEDQLVMPAVEAEIAFGLQNLGFAPAVIDRRVAEVLYYFGLEDLRQRPVASLSGGQKQKLALAAALAPQPQVLLLDEPTSQLDPLATVEILHFLRRLNEESGLTVILAEQRLDHCLALADIALIMEEGRVAWRGKPGQMATWAVRAGREELLPAVPRLFAGCGWQPPPLTVKDGRRRLAGLNFVRGEGGAGTAAPPGAKAGYGAAAAETAPLALMQQVDFVYPGGSQVLNGVSLKVGAGEIVAIVGSNGAGKTTLLKHFNGLLRPARGRVLVAGRDTRRHTVEEMARLVAYLPQHCAAMFCRPTVQRELEFTQEARQQAAPGLVEETLDLLGLAELAGADPRDLSGGERQLAALAAVLVGQPQLLVLDEPTRGLDAAARERLGTSLVRLAASGRAVCLASHDVEFIAEWAQRVVLLAGGRVVADGPKEDLLASSLAFAPQVCRLFRGFCEDVLTFDEAGLVLNRALSSVIGDSVAGNGTGRL